MKISPISGGAFKSFYSKREQLEKKVQLSADINNKKRKENENNVKKAVLAASLIGAIAPVVVSNVMKGRGAELIDTFKNSSSIKEKAKSIGNIFEVKNFSQILMSTTGGILASVAAGVKTDKNPENKNAKYKEGVFEFLNTMTPTVFVALGENLISKHEDKLKAAAGKLKDSDNNKIKLMRAGLIIGAVAGGMFVANKTSNKINEECFKKEENEKKREFKISDCFVHLDDLIGLFVLSKSPALNTIANKVQMDKVLPFLYAKTGYEAGTSTKEDFCKKGWINLKRSSIFLQAFSFWYNWTILYRLLHPF